MIEDRGTWREEVRSEERGRGIVLMKHLMDSAEIETGANGTRVVLSRRLRLDRQTTAEWAAIPRA